jgi:uncharacterized protein
MPITALYAGLLTPLFIFLAIRVIRERRGAQVSVGHGDNARLLRKMRVHANFAEYVPLALLLMGLAESVKSDARLLHVDGIILVVGRIVHAIGLSRQPESIPLRAIGMVATFTVLSLGALMCLVYAIATLTRG